MTQHGNLEALQQVAALKYQREASELAKLIQKAQNLRNQIAKLRAQAGNQTLSPEMAKIGADVAWQSWTEQQIRNLNLALAGVLAAQQKQMTRVRPSFGQQQAIDQIKSRIKPKSR